MATRKALVRINGQVRQMPDGDIIEGSTAILNEAAVVLSFTLNANMELCVNFANFTDDVQFYLEDGHLMFEIIE